MARVIQKILNKVLTERYILKGLNFAGLPGDCASAPIHIVNNLIVYLKEEKLRCEFYCRILEKPSIHYYEVWSNRGIRGEEGIDQGEIIFLLVWQITYDPLLCKLQQLEKGFEIKLRWSILAQRETKTEVFRTKCIAYADDTTLFAPFRENLQIKVILAETYRYHITEWQVRINNGGPLEEFTRLRLKKAQLDLCSPTSIWELNREQHIQYITSHNLNYRIMVLAKKLNLDVPKSIATKNWDLTKGEVTNGTIMHLLKIIGWAGNIKSLQKLELWFIDKLYDMCSEMMLTW
ncbi:reverse transcriptase [Gigaspora margarita]|uniref:Reverse transcriptase n=1 Tax=Gigaspora margarita TaxID=4874 RepID=A0A8H4ERM2_GIGMA|nr:reverse transcriptase [Gigaspora margarita]